jgi:hypothetical protein
MGRARTTEPTPYESRPTVNEGLADCGHASHATYVVGRCRCDACRRANAKYEHDRTLRKLQGRELFVDADLARRKVAELRERGYTVKEIERLSGVGHTWMHSLTRFHPRTGKPVTRCSRANYEALCAIDSRDPSDGQRVDAAPAVALVRRVNDAGLPLAEVARVSGVDYQVVRSLFHARARTCEFRNLRALFAAKDELEARCPREPSRVIRCYDAPASQEFRHRRRKEGK